jgi:alkylated DNA repair dioxygenase AlkB
MTQLSLLPAATEVPPIPGLVYVAEFCSEAEERALVEAIDREPWSHEYSRRRQHYGASYEDARAPATRPMPAWVGSIGERLVARGLFAEPPNGCLVNEYLPGQGIAPHLDRVWAGPIVASLSLASACGMDFIHAEDRARRHVLWLPRRSVVVLSGEARHAWMHGIAQRKSDLHEGHRLPRERRVSITLRCRQDAQFSK